MISYIKGQLADVETDSIVIDVSGIGWHIYVPGQMIDRLPAIGETIKVYTYLQVREDAMTLFGFLDKDGLEIFQLLISVNGIGPKAALAILSVMSTDDLRFAIIGDDAKAIAKAPGVGAKIAKRLILELKDKVSLEDAFSQQTESMPGFQPSDTAGGIKEEALLALTALGYSSSEACKALNGIAITEEMDVESLLKSALKRM